MKKVAVIILGKQNSGKSKTFYEFFGKKIKTGCKRFTLKGKELLVFVKNSSFEETNQTVDIDIFVKNSSFEECGENIKNYSNLNKFTDIVFCAVQYVNDDKKSGIETIQYFKDKGYYLYIQWLNPGFKPEKEYKEYEDDLKFEEIFAKVGECEFHKESGKELSNRVNKIKQFLVDYYLDNDTEK